MEKRPLYRIYLGYRWLRVGQADDAGPMDGIHDAAWAGRCWGVLGVVGETVRADKSLGGYHAHQRESGIT